MLQRLASKILDQKTSKYLLVFVLLVGFGLKIYFVYYGYIYSHYLVPPGFDGLPHYLNIKAILGTAKFDFSLYPPGFYYLVIWLSKLFHRDAFYILTYWTPMLIVLSPVAVYFLLRQLFDLKISVLTTLVFLLASGYPLYAFVDGNYPDMLAYGFFAVLLFAFLIRFFKTHRFANLAVAGVLLLLIAVTHHFTFFIVTAVLAVFGLVLLFSNRKNLDFILSRKNLGVSILGILLIILCIYFAFHFYGPVILSFAQGFLTSNPALKDTYLNLPVKLADYPSLMGPVVWYLGVAGLFYLIVSTFSEKKDIYTKLLIIVWIVVLYLLSRTSSVAVPGRFARELAVPLVIATGYLINYLLNLNVSLVSRINLVFGYGLLGYFIIMNSLLYTGIGALPNSFNEWVWFWPVDQEKIDYMTKNVSSQDPILFNPNANIYTPAKSTNSLIPLAMTKEQKTIVDSYLLNQNKANQKAYNDLVSNYEEEYPNISYIFIDVKPPSNPDPKTYPPYADFREKDTVLRAMAARGVVLQTFSDGAELVKLR